MTGNRTNLENTFYGSWAAAYDRFASAPVIRSWRRQAVASLDVDPGDTVVDLGCGTGANFDVLRDAIGKDGRVVGVDLVPAMLAEARERITRNGWENVHVIRGDAVRPPVRTADAILSTFLVGMLDDPAGAVGTWLDLVEPGGRIAMLNVGRSDRTLARPFNLPCRLFVRFTAPGHRWRRGSPVEHLEAKWEAASQRLQDGTVEYADNRIGLGFVRLVGGQRPR